MFAKLKKGFDSINPNLLLYVSSAAAAVGFVYLAYYRIVHMDAELRELFNVSVTIFVMSIITCYVTGVVLGILDNSELVAKISNMKGLLAHFTIQFPLGLIAGVIMLLYLVSRIAIPVSGFFAICYLLWGPIGKALMFLGFLWFFYMALKNR